MVSRVFKAKHIYANPFHHYERYPFDQAKIDALRDSMRSTGIWPNLVGRFKEGSEGSELAYGHHRLEAVIQEYGPEQHVTVQVEGYTDDAMLKMMVSENQEEFGTDAFVLIEALRTVVEAYGNGQIRLPQPRARTRDTNIRWAPSFVTGLVQPGNKRYTPRQIAEYIEWLTPAGEPRRIVMEGLNALGLIEQGFIDEQLLHRLNTSQLVAAVQQIRRQQNLGEKLGKEEAEILNDPDAQERTMRARREEGVERAHQLGTELPMKMRTGALGWAHAGDAAGRLLGPWRSPFDIEEWVAKLSRAIHKMTNYLDEGGDGRADQLDDLVRDRGNVPNWLLNDLIKALDDLGGRCQTFADLLGQPITEVPGDPVDLRDVDKQRRSQAKAKAKSGGGDASRSLTIIPRR